MHEVRAVVIRAVGTRRARYEDRYDDAEELFRQAIEVWEALPDVITVERGFTYANLGASLVRRGEMAEGERLLRHAVGIYEKVGEKFYAIRGLVSLYNANGDFESERAVREQMLEHRMKTLPPGHPEILNALHVLASNLHEEGLVDDAIDYERRVIEYTEEHHGPDDPILSFYYEFLEDWLTEIGNHDEAEQMSARKLQLRDKALELDPATMPFDFLYYYAMISAEHGDTVKALTFLRRFVDRLDGTGSESTVSWRSDSGR